MVEQLLEVIFADAIKEGDLTIVAEGSRDEPGRVRLNRATIGPQVTPSDTFRNVYSWAGGRIGMMLARGETIPPYYETYLIEEAQQ